MRNAVTIFFRPDLLLMSLSLSLQKTWYGLILLTSFIPVVVLLLWAGNTYHGLLLDKALQQEKYFGNLSSDHVNKEVARLLTLLQNKSDPIAYTLSPGRTPDRRLIDELLNKMIERETAISSLLLLKPDGQIFAAMERHDSSNKLPVNKPSLLEQWRSGFDKPPPSLSIPLQGKPYTGPVRHYNEGSSFTMAVPVGIPERPVAVLVADIGAHAIWNPLVEHLDNENTYLVASYLVNKQGILINTGGNTSIKTGEKISSSPIIDAFIAGRKWPTSQVYQGIDGKPVYGMIASVEPMNWGAVIEIEQEHLQKAIQTAMSKVVIGVTAIVIPFVLLGLLLAYRISKPLRELSKDFTRAGKQDYSSSTVSSSLKEVKLLVDGFNHMVNKIDLSQRDLQRAAIVFEGTSEGIIITDAKHHITAINSAFTRITGYNSQDVLGKNPIMLQSGRHDRAFFVSIWKSMKETGHWQGELWSRRKNGEVYPQLLSGNVVKDKQGNITHHIGIFNDISKIKQTEFKLEHLAHHDPLTGLPNRLLFNDRLDQAILRAQREGTQAAVLFLDLDRFKNINDSMGHAKGDLLLQRVADRMKGAMRAEDTIARLGGDEFVLVIEALKEPEDAIVVIEHILSLFKQPYCLGKQEIYIDTSLGVCFYPRDGTNAQTLVRNADAAMYRAKAEGRNNYQLYTAELTSLAIESMTLENNLRHALERNEFTLHYQPQYSLKDGGSLGGVEALIRWKQPEKGWIPPNKFIPVAEETGLIVPIGEWVLRTACTQHQAWVKAGYKPVRMAVNLSARQFHTPHLAETISEILKETGMHPSFLELELTESIIMRDAEATIKLLHKLSSMGVILSIDDFGTGYSSISYMKRFPINRLKIDQSFVRDIGCGKPEAKMIIPIIALGHSMNLQVLAEGVEIEEQLNYLLEHGCDEAQGYLYSPPIPPDELQEFLESTTEDSHHSPHSLATTNTRQK